jgi:hypothetical protein
MLDALFLRHPRSVGETYVEHLVAALGFCARLSLAALACFAHAFVPALCERTASRIIGELQMKMVAGRRAKAFEAGAYDYAI